MASDVVAKELNPPEQTGRFRYTEKIDKEAISELANVYQDNGFVIVENLLTDDELQALRDQTAAIISGQTSYPQELIELEPESVGNTDVPSVRKLNRCAENDTVYMAHACNRKILEIVTALIGEDIKLFDSQAFLKPPGGVEKPYHQDSAYFPITPMSMATCWAALDDVTVDNGSMWVIPGSHTRGVIDHSEIWMVGGRQDMRIPEHALDRRNETALTMPAGSCSFHHSLLLHSSRPNQSAMSRRGLAIHYMSARSIWTDPAQPQPDYKLLCGRAYAGCV